MKQTKGFTLLEMIVAVGMLAVFLTLLLPNVKGYKEMASTGITDSNVITLNLATKSYATFKEIINEDIFKEINNDRDRMNVLINEVLLDKEIKSLDDTKVYCWNITDQSWIVTSASTKEGCGGVFTPANPDEIYTPAPYTTPMPTDHPSALPTTKPLETDEQKSCVASSGKYDPINKSCLCPSGFVLNKEEGICITSEEYLCVNSGGSYDRTNQACACPSEKDLTLNDDKTLCIKLVEPKDCPIGTKLNMKTNQCDKRFNYESTNPNYILAENRLKPKSLADILTYEEYQTKAKSTSADLLYLNPGEYFIYNSEIFYVRLTVPIQSTVNFDQFIVVNQASLFNLPDAARTAKFNTIYFKNELVLQDKIWYSTKTDNVSSKPGSDANWNTCGSSIDEITKNGVCSLK